MELNTPPSYDSHFTRKCVENAQRPQDFLQLKYFARHLLFL